MLPPFGWSAVVTQWQFAPVVTVFAVVCAVLYGWGVVRVARRHPARPWPLWRTGMFAGGLAVIVIATQSGVGAYDDVLFWDHMVQHLMLLMVAPPLLIAGQPMTLLMHASRNPVHRWTRRALRSRVATFLTWPVFGALAYTGAVVAAHLTSLANLVETNQTEHDAEHAGFLIIGYLFFLPLIGREPIRWRLSYPMRFVILVLVMPVDTFTGLVLGYGGGGGVMWIGGDAIMFGLMMLVYLMWSMDDRDTASSHGWLERARKANMATLVASHQPAPGPAGAAPADDGSPAAGVAAGRGEDRGGVDHADHLAPSNAFLARLNQRGPGPGQ